MACLVCRLWQAPSLQGDAPPYAALYGFHQRTPMDNEGLVEHDKGPTLLPFEPQSLHALLGASTTVLSTKASSRFFERLAHRLTGDALQSDVFDLVQLHELVTEQSHTPACSTLRRRRAD